MTKDQTKATAIKPAAVTGARAFRLDEAPLIDEDARTVSLSFSSEEPYERFFGIEILDHAPQSVRLGRLNGGGAVLMDHDTRDQVGVVVDASIGADRKGRAVVRFGKSQRASEVFEDVKDGIRTLMSVGYRIHKLILEKEENGVETFRVTDWEPFEISIVSVPADPSVGIGRAADEPAADPRKLLETRKEVKMETTAVAPAPEAPKIDVKAERDAARNEERQRQANIRALGRRVDGAHELVDQAIADGWNFDKFRDALDKYETTRESKPLAEVDDPQIGLTEAETRQYSIVRLLRALANPQDRQAQEEAGFEIEASCAAQRKVGRDGRSVNGYTVPVDVLRSPLAFTPAGHAAYQRGDALGATMFSGLSQRELTVGTATAGGHTVATDLLAASFIDILRNRLAIMNLGATMLGDLVGNVAIPRQTGAATMQWVSEGNAAAESQQAFDQIALAPKTASAWVDMTRRLLLQSSIDVEAFVRADLAAIIALGIDLAAINGSGSSGQPRGILQTAGIGSVALGTNGAAPTFESIVDLETAVAVENADIGNTAYLTNAKMRGKLKKTQMFDATNGRPVWESDEMNGYRAMASNQVPGNLTKGTGTDLSAILFGNFADVILGMWGGLDLTVDPFTSSTSGTVRIVALQDVDVVLRRVVSFAAITDAIA